MFSQSSSRPLRSLQDVQESPSCSQKAPPLTNPTLLPLVFHLHQLLPSVFVSPSWPLVFCGVRIRLDRRIRFILLQPTLLRSVFHLHQLLPSIFVSPSWPFVFWVVRLRLGGGIRYPLVSPLPLLARLAIGLPPPGVRPSSERRSQIPAVWHEVSMRRAESWERFLLAGCILFVQAARRLPFPVLAGMGLRRVATGMAPNPQLKIPPPPVAGASLVDRRTHGSEILLLVLFCHGLPSGG